MVRAEENGAVLAGPQTATTKDWLTRDRAAEFVRAKGIETVTAVTLAKLAAAGRGPPYFRMGKHAFYEPAALDAWIKEEMKPVARGRKEAKAA